MKKIFLFFLCQKSYTLNQSFIGKYGKHLDFQRKMKLEVSFLGGN